MGVKKKGAPHQASHKPVRGFLCVFASLREPSAPLARPQRALLDLHQPTLLRILKERNHIG